MFDTFSLFDRPKIIAIVGDVGEAKSNTLYWLITELRKKGKFKLMSYGLKFKIQGALEINSVEELESARDSIIILDEVMSLWDLENRMAKNQIEKSLRLIEHRNNILVLCAIPENLKKFICGKIKNYIFKTVTLSDFINGSSVKKVVTNYKGNEMGSTVLKLSKGEGLIFDGKHYYLVTIPYLPQYDSKAKNEPIIKLFENVTKSVNQNVNQNVSKNVGEKNGY